jgi:hypothetical protein
MNASGEKNLNQLLTHLNPELELSPYVFCSVPENQLPALKLEPRGTFREQEGVTLILVQPQADEAGLEYQGVWACITLSVHSSLEAVGLIATVAARLAQSDISANPVAGYYHDHLFVPWDRRGEAMALLLDLQKPAIPQETNSHPRL